jgi:hypothetical protein
MCSSTDLSAESSMRTNRQLFNIVPHLSPIALSWLAWRKLMRGCAIGNTNDTKLSSKRRSAIARKASDSPVGKS